MGMMNRSNLIGVISTILFLGNVIPFEGDLHQLSEKFTRNHTASPDKHRDTENDVQGSPCIVPKVPANSTLHIYMKNKKMYATYKCSIGQVVHINDIPWGGIEYTDLCINATWATGNVTCKTTPFRCPALQAPLNGVIVKDDGHAANVSSKVGITVVLFCRDGYVMAGHEMSLCTLHGWDRKIGQCLPFNVTFENGCQLNSLKLKKTQHSKPVDTKLNVIQTVGHVTVVEISCIVGYNLYQDGSRLNLKETVLYCDMDDRVWRPTQAFKCVDRGTLCPKLADPPNGTFITTGHFVNTHGTVECNDGFVLFGQRTKFCEPNGRWSSGSYTCLEPGRIAKFENKHSHRLLHKIIDAEDNATSTDANDYNTTKSFQWFDAVPVEDLPQPALNADRIFKMNKKSFRITNKSDSKCDIITDSILRSMGLVFKTISYVNYPDRISEYITGDIQSLDVIVRSSDCPKLPNIDMDESYKLVINSEEAILEANEVWGIVRGLETFTQMVYISENQGFLINETHVEDYPRFKHRGVLLDSARHFLPMDIILQNLDAMCQNKFNVLHWHLIDDQSFPLECKTYPNLTLKGAYNSGTYVLNHNDVTEVISYARLRGIRVIPEFDTPGHVFSWGKSYKELLTPCYSVNGTLDGGYGPLHPTRPETYTFIENFFKEYLELFPDSYIHLGGDEVPFSCWEHEPDIKIFMGQMGYMNSVEVWNYYENRLLKIISSLTTRRAVKSTPIFWQEVLDFRLYIPHTAVVEVWKSDVTIEKILEYTKTNHSLLIASCWYLDNVKYGIDWHRFYNCRLLDQIEMLNDTDKNMILGGEVCMWTEFVDEQEIMPRLWPRASAAAERLWSNESVFVGDKAAPRIEEHRCRMIGRGFKVGVLNGPGFCRRPLKDEEDLTVKPNVKTSESDVLISRLTTSNGRVTRKSDAVSDVEKENDAKLYEFGYDTYFMGTLCVISLVMMDNSSPRQLILRQLIPKTTRPQYISSQDNLWAPLL
ncbi:unnamed protein product [Owenia fusiformis]|uniref:beta-N-acetylhexosaminidase n=1 Tax=Owenia fusiformis TaxID=6347 RepID=A0A8J1TUJ3_OWEFU|nr:unnamed protein product [Owenia fusiformis]